VDGDIHPFRVDVGSATTKLLSSLDEIKKIFLFGQSFDKFKNQFKNSVPILKCKPYIAIYFFMINYLINFSIGFIEIQPPEPLKRTVTESKNFIKDSQYIIFMI